MNFGIFKWFNEEKGFGVIISANKFKQEIFLHISNWNKSDSIHERFQRELLEFNTATQRNKLSAINCGYFKYDEEKSWEELFSLLPDDYNIRVDYKSYNVLELALSQVPPDFNSDIIIHAVKNKLVDVHDDKSLRNNILYSFLSKQINESIKSLINRQICERLQKLDGDIQIQIWIGGAIESYEPTLENFKSNLDIISSLKVVKRIKEESNRNLILIACLKKIEGRFNYSWFCEFAEILESISCSRFKEKVLMDLNRLAKTSYKKYLLEFVRNQVVNFEEPANKIQSIISEHPDFITKEIVEDLNKELIDLILISLNVNDLSKLWLKGIIDDVSIQITENIEALNDRQCENLLRHESFPKPIKHLILESWFNKREYKFVLKNCKESCSDFYAEFDKKIFEEHTDDEYYELWKEKLGIRVPEEFLLSYIGEESFRSSEIDYWIEDEIISETEIANLLLKKLDSYKTINNRNDFNSLMVLVEKFIELNQNNADQLVALENEFINLILWHIGAREELNLELIRRKFIFFSPEEQVRIFKRLFYLKHIGQIDFSFDYIEKLVRADIDLYLTNEQFGNDFVLDISTHIIIEAISSFIKKGSFEFESDLILKDLKRNSKKKFLVENYFDKCEGRMLAHWNWNTEGKVKQISFPGDSLKFYYAIEFQAAFEREGKSYYGGVYTFHEKNPNFEHLKNEVKKLPHRKWNPDKNHWGVPSKFKNEVYEFARMNRFFVELDDRKHYTNNVHLVEYSRYMDGEPNVPKGIQFCEGRKAKKKHQQFNREFWWCTNQECFENCSENHLNLKIKIDKDSERQVWEYYTLLDILKILEINVDETKTNPIDYIPDGHYYKLLGHINAFNRLLRKLYCEECGELLYPTQTSHFALYRDTRFHCENEKCESYKKTIYLNHCLNGECTNIIDSRVSKQCENGLYICDNCGTCCSNDMFKRRLDSLNLTGGYAHQALIDNVKNKNGHLEKKEYYCFKCQNMVTEISDTLFRCEKCNVQYDLDKFKWLERRWTMKYARRADYPIRTVTNDDGD
ncbi:cold shock domain-containing protein [Maribellus mangrovi]|uniref:cold shock domain-containing protein n=1 Tax=Maribellus mangrovi TaxID=3133146 RepID=UPI0030EF6A0B